MIEVQVSLSRQEALAECARRGLIVRSDREIAGRKGSHHYHLAFSDKPGTLELNEWQGNVWFSVNERRDCGWASALANEIAAHRHLRPGQASPQRARRSRLLPLSSGRVLDHVLGDQAEIES